MNTPTHLLIGAAVLARPQSETGERWRNPVVLAAALLPDLGLFVLFAWERIVRGVTEEELWRVIYWQDHWQAVLAVGNSVPLYLTLLVAGLVWRRTRCGALAVLAAAAALLHVAFDLPFHNTDAHRHFWPLSDWKFHSPISYWDPAFGGNIVSVLEALLGVVLCIILWRRFADRRVRALLALALASYIAVPIYFGAVIDHH